MNRVVTGLVAVGLALILFVLPRPAPAATSQFIEVPYETMYWSLRAEYPEAKWHRTSQDYLVPTDVLYWWDYYNKHVLPNIDTPNMYKHWEGWTSPVLTLKAMSDAKWDNPRLPIGRVDGLIHTRFSWGYHMWNIVATAPGGVCCTWYIIDTESPRYSACYYINGDDKPCVPGLPERGIFPKPQGWTAIGWVEL